MNNLRGLPGIRRMGKVPNAQLRELYRVKKGVGKKIDEGSNASAIWKGWIKRVCW